MKRHQKRPPRKATQSAQSPGGNKCKACKECREGHPKSLEKTGLSGRTQHKDHVVGKDKEINNFELETEGERGKNAPTKGEDGKRTHDEMATGGPRERQNRTRFHAENAPVFKGGGGVSRGKTESSSETGGTRLVIFKKVPPKTKD